MKFEGKSGVSTTHYKSFFNNATIGFVIVDLNGHLKSCNKFFSEIVGYKQEELVGLHFKEITHPDDYDVDEAHLIELLGGNLPHYEIEKRYIHKNGRIVWANLLVNLIKDGGISYLTAVVQDITQRKDSLQRISKQNDNLNIFLENTSDSIWSVDRDYNLIFVNKTMVKAFRDIFGIELKPGVSIVEVGVKEEKESWIKLYNRALSGESFITEYKPYLELPNVYQLTLSPIFNGPEVIGVNVISRDITEQKEREFDIQCQKEFILQSQKEAKIGSWTLNKVTGELEATDTLYNIFGLEASSREPKVLLNKLYQAVHEEDKIYINDFEEVILAKNKPFSLALRIRTSSCEIKYIRVIGGECFKDPVSGDLIQLGSIQDVTDFKTQQLRLLEDEQRIKALTSNPNIGVGLVDFNGNIFKANDAMSKILGYSEDELTNMTIRDITHTEDRNHTKNYIDDLKNGKIDAYQTEKRYVNKNEKIVWCQLNTTVVKDQNNIPVYMMGQLQDITERKNEELFIKNIVRERTRRLELINEELEAFTYSVSHDLRAPLRSINGFSEILLDGYGDKVGEEGLLFLKKINKASNRMGELIDDLLKLSRLSRSQTNRSKLNLSELALGVSKSVAISENYKDAEFDIQEGLFAEGDQKLIKILLENLINNACKYSSKRKEPRVEIGKTIIEGQKAFFIKDNGEGFDMNNIENLFKVFHRLHTDDEFQGAGIGLSIVKKIIDLHNGKIWADSKRGEGATFYFFL